MQLFALVSSPNQNEENRRNVVRNYLSLQLNSQRVDEHLSLFDLYIHEQEIKLRETSKLKKRYAASSVKILRIATAINEELTHYQKLIVIIQLLEFLNSGSRGISAIEIEFANTIAETFNINSKEYLEIYAFITDNFKNQSPGNNLLIISGDKEHKKKQGYLYREHLQNELRILNIHSGNVMLLKSKKSSDLTINGQIIQPGKIHFMRPGSSLRHRRSTPITYTTIASQFYKSQQKEPIHFQAKDISFNYAKSAVGLHPMNFSSGSGSLVGIMGDSGAGKTTLINLLTGILKPKSGSITINGANIHNNPQKVKGLIGYVSQDDLLIEDLTVYQNLYYNATLCFDHISKSNIKRKVLSLLKALGLYDIKDMKVGNPLNKKISGGQRKRLNIALELIREPAVMFMDEPTSGLSSRDSENIMDLLKELALKGKLIFVVIHQPSSDIFKMFDQLLVLDTGGYLIYDGDAVEALTISKTVSIISIERKVNARYVAT
ncbi:ABC transporter ATP-binding protein [Geofilum rubicundum JCM 15548]|uniref:ABC transporter ATP-binding protein n=2 Tax=Geofilum TaxID=1236988 RepID=A0A0E9LTL4_9BACT|nr:ABC transporter ATP-binding protein [Geofilum rubicundum JCM 15548]